MNAILIISLIIGTIILFIFVIKISKRSRYISNVISKYPIQVSTLCGTNVEYLDSHVKNKIRSFPLDDWIDWTNKIEILISYSKIYPEVMSDYILYYFPYVKDVPHHKNFKLFDPAVTRCKILIECLYYNDILKLCQITREEWLSRKETKSQADAIILSNPDAIKELRKKDSSLMDEDIIKHRKRIEQIQKRYNIASAFNTWIPTQKTFNSLVRNLRDEYAKNCGCYTYEIEFQKPLPSGKTSIDKVSVWQVFANSISPYLKEYHSTLSFSMQDNIPEFKSRTRYYNDFVYDRIIPYIRAISSDKSIVVVFNSSTSYQWSMDTYNYHYRYLKSILDNENIPYANMGDILSCVKDFSYDIILVFDFITVNTDLIFTSKLLIESFTIKTPNFVWYSMIKEYDENEMKSLCENVIKEAEKKKEEEERKAREEIENLTILNSKEKTVSYIEKLLKRVNKSSRFTIFAVTNTLIGSAANSAQIKKMWMSEPSRIMVTSSSDVIRKRNGYITVKYSEDFGSSWTTFELEGLYEEANYVAKFTYELFAKLDLLVEFIKHGEKAIDFINTNEYLK